MKERVKYKSELSEETANIIIQDLLNKYTHLNSATIIADYGTYNGCVALTTSVDRTSVAAIIPEIIGGITFYIWNYSIRTWYNGEFYSLQQAYEEGFLTKDDLKAINARYRSFTDSVPY